MDLFIIPPIDFLEFSPCPGLFTGDIQHWESTVENIMIALFTWTTLGPPMQEINEIVPFPLVAFLLFNLYQSSLHTSTPSHLNSTWGFQNWAINHFEKRNPKEKWFLCGKQHSNWIFEESYWGVGEWQYAQETVSSRHKVACKRDEKSRIEKYPLVSNGRGTHK